MKIVNFCECCGKKYRDKYVCCPTCGVDLKVMPKFNVKKGFEPYLKGTGFTIQKEGQVYGDYILKYRGSTKDKDKDSKKMIKRFVENKPDFFTPIIDVYKDPCDIITLTVELKSRVFHLLSMFYFPFNKGNFSLIQGLLSKDNVSKLIEKCKQEKTWQEEKIKNASDLLKDFQNLENLLLEFKEEK